MTKRHELLKTFGRRLREYRKLRGWTQEELPRRTNRHWTYLGGLERGERNPTLVVLGDLAKALEISPGELLEDPHDLCARLGAPSRDILVAIERGFRAQIDVKGKLAELYLHRRLEMLLAEKVISSVTWQDIDGQPDFLVDYRGKRFKIECKNVRSEAYRRPPGFKVELQRTRNSRDGTSTRAYRCDEFDVLAVALFNQTNRWDYLYVATRHLSRRTSLPDCLEIMQRVPAQASGHWHADLEAALRDCMTDVK